MPKTREICNIINQALQAGNFASRRFQQGNWALVANLLSKIEQTEGAEKEIKQPAIVDNEGEGVDVSFNDTYPIQFYHRILNITPEDDLNETFGNPGTTIKETSDMVLICMGDRNKLKVVLEDILSAIWADIPRELKHSDLQSLTLQSVNIIPGEINNNSQEIFNQEFVNVDYALAPENFMCALKYKIVTLYSKNCFQLCN